MNIGISNWHNWNFDPTNMTFFTLFQFLTRFLTSKYPKLFSTYLVGRNGAKWKTRFSAPQNTKKENQLKQIKPIALQTFYWLLILREWRIILIITRWVHNSQTFTLISKINENFEIFYLRVTGYVNTKTSISNYMFVIMISWKCASHI